MARYSEDYRVESCDASSALWHSEFLHDLPPDLVGKILFEADAQFTAKDQSVVLCCEDSDYIGIMQSGFIEVVRSSSDESEGYCMDVLGPGDVFGLAACMAGGLHFETTDAITDVEYLRIKRSTVWTLFESSEKFRNRVLVSLASTIRRRSVMLEILLKGHVSHKIGSVLLLFAREHSSSGRSGVTLACPMSRKLIARMAGTTVESVIRVLSKWQKMKIIQTESQHISIVSESALRETLAESV